MFTTILIIMLSLLVVYYGVVIAFDLYQQKQMEQAENEKKNEQEIDISGIAEGFRPVEIRRNDIKRKPESHRMDAGNSDDKPVDTDSEKKENTAEIQTGRKVRQPIMTDGYEVTELVNNLEVITEQEQPELTSFVYELRKAA